MLLYDTGGVELVDVRKRIPGLHVRPGLTSWKVSLGSGDVNLDYFKQFFKLSIFGLCLSIKIKHINV